jgi:hypothetical protein
MPRSRRESETRERHEPERRCLGCGRRAPRRDLARFVAVVAGGRATLIRDDRSRLGGRGLYVCRRSECFETARSRRAFARGARLEGIPLDVDPGLGESLAGEC